VHGVGYTVYVGLLAVVVNIVVAVIANAVHRAVSPKTATPSLGG